MESINDYNRNIGCVCRSFEFSDIPLTMAGGTAPFSLYGGADLTAELTSHETENVTTCRKRKRLCFDFTVRFRYRDCPGVTRIATAEFSRCVTIEVPAGVYGCANPRYTVRLISLTPTFGSTSSTISLKIGLTICPSPSDDPVTYEYDESSYGGCANGTSGITLPYSLLGTYTNGSSNGSNGSCGCANNGSWYGDGWYGDGRYGWYNSDAWITPSGSTYWSNLNSGSGSCCGSNGMSGCGCGCSNGTGTGSSSCCG